MAGRSITFFSAGNGNCCLIMIDDFSIVVDLHGSGDETSWDLIRPYLPVKAGVRHIDVLCITHGDKDHCGGFEILKKEMDKKRLVIGSIWHPNFDRTKVDSIADLPDDYKVLHSEIMRRHEVEDPQYGDIEQPLTAWDTERIAFAGFETVPQNLSLHVLSPYLKDDEEGEFDINDMCLVLNLEISGLRVLFPGDSGSAIWSDRIFAHTLDSDDKSDWGQADVLVASHHGSYKFFGSDREEVLNADPEPENYQALDSIGFSDLVVSSASRFPTSGDESGDDPPHYAAWKWYHKWVQDNRGVGEDDKHPSCFKYTADGHLRLEYGDEGWVWRTDWSPDDDGGSSDDSAPSEAGKAGLTAIGFKYREGKTRRGPGHYA